MGELFTVDDCTKKWKTQGLIREGIEKGERKEVEIVVQHLCLHGSSLLNYSSYRTQYVIASKTNVEHSSIYFSVVSN